MPKKSLGQHFLTDPAILERIVDFSGVGTGDHVVEIGPGLGTLTRSLARRVETVTAIEIDPGLVQGLRAKLPGNVEIVEADALDVDFRTIGPSPCHVVANLPYNVATPLIERFVRARDCIQSVTILIQKEVADRILARPATPDYGVLTVGVQYFADVDRGFVLAPGAFRPPPKVHSRVIRLRWKPGVVDNPAFLRFVRGAFAARRKTLANNLGAMWPELDRKTILDAITTTGHAPPVRAERVSIEDLSRLFTRLSGT